jgi:hypothetical protein
VSTMYCPVNLKYVILCKLLWVDINIIANSTRYIIVWLSVMYTLWNIENPNIIVLNSYMYNCVMVRVRVFSATFKNISVISCRSIVYWWGKPEKTTEKPCIEYTTPWTVFELATLVVIGTECTGSCKSNYHTAPYCRKWIVSDTCLHVTIINTRSFILLHNI